MGNALHFATSVAPPFDRRIALGLQRGSDRSRRAKKYPIASVDQARCTRVNSAAKRGHRESKNIVSANEYRFRKYRESRNRSPATQKLWRKATRCDNILAPNDSGAR
jgi:hypothetical protein